MLFATLSLLSCLLAVLAAPIDGSDAQIHLATRRKKVGGPTLNNRNCIPVNDTDMILSYEIYRDAWCSDAKAQYNVVGVRETKELPEPGDLSCRGYFASQHDYHGGEVQEAIINGTRMSLPSPYGAYQPNVGVQENADTSARRLYTTDNMAYNSYVGLCHQHRSKVCNDPTPNPKQGCDADGHMRGRCEVIQEKIKTLRI